MQIRRLKIEHFSIEYRKSMPLKIMHLRPAASWCLDKGKTLLDEILIVRKHFIVDWQVSTCGIKLLPKRYCRSVHKCSVPNGFVFNWFALKNVTRGNVAVEEP